MGRWLEESLKIEPHARAILPRSTKGIARITGLTEDQVKTYLYRKRKKSKAMMAQVLELLKEADRATFRAQDGRLIDVKELGNLRFGYDHWALSIHLLGDDEDGMVVKFPVGNLETIVELLSQSPGQKED